jgi:hypothetical protein
MKNGLILTHFFSFLIWKNVMIIDIFSGFLLKIKKNLEKRKKTENKKEENCFFLLRDAAYTSILEIDTLGYSLAIKLP